MGKNMSGGLVGVFGTTTICQSTDTSMYCNIMKLFNLLVIFVMVFGGIIFIYTTFIGPRFFKNGRK